MTKYEQLKKRICEELPRLQDLKEGQNYLRKKKPLEFRCLDFYSDNILLYEPITCEAKWYKIHKLNRDFQVLGIEPNLSDVLEYIGVDYEEQPYYINVYGELMTSKSVFKAKWDLSKPLLKDQSEELIDYLLSL